MHIYRRRVTLSETDATGVIYFTEKLKIASEAFEDFLISKKWPLRDLIEKSEFLMPIVHAEADYSAPLWVGDLVEVRLKLAEMGTSSFTLEAELWKNEMVGKTRIVHVTVSRISGKAIPLPEMLKSHLLQL